MDINNESVTHKTARTTLWGGVEKLFGLGIQFVISMLLARLLSPDDYGAIAMLTVFIAISNQFVACGFINALIRKIDCKSIDYSTAFYFNIVVSLVCYAFLCFVAPYIAQFYNMAILCPVLRACSLSIPIGALSLVQDAILQRNLQVKKLMVVSLMSSIISGSLSVLLAYKGYGIWALVFYQIFGGVLRAIMLWYKTTWIPKWEFSKKSMKYLWNFGSKMLLTEFISLTYANVYSIVIGKAYNSNALGVFNRGQNIAVLLPNIIEGIFVKNSMPIMSQIQNDKNHLIHVYQEFIKITCFLTFPMVFLSMILARPFVLVFLTEKWLGAVIYIQIFSISALLSPANSVNLNLLQVLGRTDYTLKAEMLKKSLGFLMVFTILPYGPLSLAIAYSLFSLFCIFVNLYYAKKLSGLSYKQQTKIVTPVFGCSILMSVIVLFTVFSIESEFLQLATGVLIGLISYLLFAYYVFKVDTMRKILSLARNL